MRLRPFFIYTNYQIESEVLIIRTVRCIIEYISILMGNPLETIIKCQGFIRCHS